MPEQKMRFIKHALDPESKLDLVQARALLEREVEEARSSWGTPVALKALAYLLYLEGHLEDAPLIWRAKTSNFDCFSSLDIELVAGAGPEATIEYFESVKLQDLPIVEHSGQSWTASTYMQACLQSGDFTRRDPDYIVSVEDEIRDNLEDLGIG